MSGMSLNSLPSFHRTHRNPQAAAWGLGVLLMAASCSGAPLPVPSAAATPGSDRTTNPAPPAERVVAIGDLHADLDDTLAVFEMTGLTDKAGKWVGGQTIFVQTGDLTDRGPDSKEVIELLQALEPQAAAAGGKVIALMGNHEAMNMTGDLRYVSPLDVADFGTATARATAFSASGEIGQWLRARDVVQKVDTTIFVHGGMSPAWAERGLEGTNADARHAIDHNPRAPVLGPEGPLWLRDYLLADEALACPALQRALTSMGATRMVVGHTTQSSGRVAVRCGGALVGIDTGISSHYGQNHAAVEIIRGDLRALYPSGAEDLPDPR